MSCCLSWVGDARKRGRSNFSAQANSDAGASVQGKDSVECYHHTVPPHVVEFNPKLSVHLLYTLDGKKDRRIVADCEKIWVHRDDLVKYEAEAKRTVRRMLVPLSRNGRS